MLSTNRGLPDAYKIVRITQSVAFFRRHFELSVGLIGSLLISLALYLVGENLWVPLIAAAGVGDAIIIEIVMLAILVTVFSAICAAVVSIRPFLYELPESRPTRFVGALSGS
jgi:hypothetical protein